MKELRSNAAYLSLLCALLMLPTLAVAAPARGQDAVSAEPEVQDVYVVMRDMGLQYENVVIRTIVPHEEGASALVGLTGGTLVDVVLTPAASG